MPRLVGLGHPSWGQSLSGTRLGRIVGQIRGCARLDGMHVMVLTCVCLLLLLLQRRRGSALLSYSASGCTWEWSFHVAVVKDAAACVLGQAARGDTL